jgi:hypothetical protein
MRKLKLEDLKCVDGLYYIGDLIDVDGNPWVEDQEALKIIDIINTKELERICEHDQIMRSLHAKHRIADYIKRGAKQDPIKQLK